jgi:hypothetical protein
MSIFHGIGFAFLADELNCLAFDGGGARLSIGDGVPSGPRFGSRGTIFAAGTGARFMISTTTRLARTGLVLTIAALGIAGRADRASGQYRLDPYRPDSAQYESFVFPIVPNNLGLPGAAREAAEYNAAATGGSRFNTFERYLQENDLDLSSSSSRRSGPGVPYYDSLGRTNSGRSSTYAPGREAARKIAEYEARLQQIETQRNRLYAAALREKDPIKKDSILREYRDLSKQLESRTLPSSTGREGDTLRAPARMAPASATPRRSASENLAAEALAAPSTNATRPRTPRATAPTTTPSATAPGATPRRSRPEDFLPESRPLLPSEMLDREERVRRARPAPARPSATDAPAPVPSPVPSPDSTAPPR